MKNVSPWEESAEGANKIPAEIEGVRRRPQQNQVQKDTDTGLVASKAG